MTDQKKLRRSLSKSLLRKQRKHETMLAKVEEASARLERRKAKLMALETDIADLKGRLSKPRKGDPPIAAADSVQPEEEPALAGA